MYGERTVIRFLFKTAFWGFAALLILPSVAPQDATAPAVTDVSKLDASTSDDVLAFAGGVAMDLGTICLRQPELCETGRALANAAIVRARQGLEIAGDLIVDHGASADEG